MIKKSTVVKIYALRNTLVISNTSVFLKFRKTFTEESFCLTGRLDYIIQPRFLRDAHWLISCISVLVASDLAAKQFLLFVVMVPKY